MESFGLDSILLTQGSRADLEVISLIIVGWGIRGGVVVKALNYKQAGRGFDSRWCHWNFSVT
jgi:hypothetical protein